MDEPELNAAGGSLEADLGSGESGIATTSFTTGPEGFGTRAESDALHLTGSVAHVLRDRLHLHRHSPIRDPPGIVGATTT